MSHSAAEIARALSRHALDVCRHYLSHGQRQGTYWTVGDLGNAPGRSLFVRLAGPDYGPGAAGHWTDAATGEHGDLLDLIRAACELRGLPEALEEAARFLALPPPPAPDAARPVVIARSGSSVIAARQLFVRGGAVRGGIAETYLARRGIVGLAPASLRFHRAIRYRTGEGADFELLPALLAAATDLDGHVMGVQRTWLAPNGDGKAAVATPRRALGRLLGHGVRVGEAHEVLATGEGVETMLSLLMPLPRLPIVAALSANNLAMLALRPGLRRLYIARDNDPAGERAARRLRERADQAGVDVIDLAPHLGDFNDDLLELGPERLREQLRPQMLAEDFARFG